MGNEAVSEERGVSFRVLVPDDCDLVAHMEQQLFPEDPWSHDLVFHELSGTGRHYVAAEMGETPVGYGGIMCGLDADITTIGVVEKWRGRGVGALLLRELVRAAREAGSERVFLEVRASNEGAQRLYENAGFERIGYVRNYFRHPREDAVTMRLVLQRKRSTESLA